MALRTKNYCVTKCKQCATIFFRETICRAGIRLVHQMPTNCTQRLATASNCLLLVAHRLPTSCAACWASGVMEATFMARRTSSRSRPSWRAVSDSPPLFPRPPRETCATCAGLFSLPTSLHHSATFRPSTLDFWRNLRQNLPALKACSCGRLHALHVSHTAV